MSYSKEQILKVEELRSNGATWEEAAKQIGGSESGLRHYFKRHSIRKCRTCKATPEQIADYYFQNNKIKESTASYFGVSLWSLSKALIEANHPEEAYPCMLKRYNIILPISPDKPLNQQPESNGYIRQFAQELMQLVTNLENTQQENQELKEKLAKTIDLFNRYKLNVQEILTKLR